MENKIPIFFEQLEQTIEVNVGTTLFELFNEVKIDLRFPPIGAYVNNAIEDLQYKIFRPVSLRYFDITHFEGYRIYVRTLSFILKTVLEELYPDNKLVVYNSVGCSMYAELKSKEEFSEEEAENVKSAMQAIIEANIPLRTDILNTQEVLYLYQKCGYHDKIELVQSRMKLYTKTQFLDRSSGYFYGVLAPSTSYVTAFDLVPMYKGLLVLMADNLSPRNVFHLPQSKKMLCIFAQYKQWMDVMGVRNVGTLNRRVKAGDASELIKIAEAFQEKLLGNIADSICEAHKKRGVKVVLISGPSSSGKTTTSKRLGIQLRILGLHPVLISLDDYFVDREHTPRDENGKYDFEALEALDVKQINEHLKLLFEGESVDIPRYDFITGTRQWHNNPLRMDESSILIMEGIHGLNPKLTADVDDNLKFKIYVSCLTDIAMDDTTYVSNFDNRLLRRITRDYATRGYDASATLAMWGSVRRGEEKHIFPYRENADVIFNSSLFYEISVLKPFVTPILREVPDSLPEYGEAKRLLDFLDNFTAIDPGEIPPTSILREFIGGSSFKY
ncbi:MAG: nucleoside kinase [Alistipes sp.]|nr:nucleoside kinase [Candidatus Alistipes equi]